MGFVTNHDRCRKIFQTIKAQKSLLQHGLLADQREQLLRIKFSGEGPETSSGPTAQNDGYDLVLEIICHHLDYRFPGLIRVDAGE